MYGGEPHARARLGLRGAPRHVGAQLGDAEVQDLDARPMGFEGSGMT